MKTNIKKLIHFSSVMLALILALGVLVTATHARDILATVSQHSPISTDPSIKKADDPVAKSINDLHSHTDKTMLKSFTKSVGDDTSSLAARREREDITEEKPLTHRFIEMMLMAHITFAFALAR